MRVTCPHCGVAGDLPPHVVGIAKCPACQKLFQAAPVPSIAESVSLRLAAAARGLIRAVPVLEWHTPALLRQRPFVSALLLAVLVVVPLGLSLRSHWSRQAPPLGHLDEMLGWFAGRGMFTRAGFTPEHAQSEPLRGRDLFVVPVFGDVTRGMGATIYFDDNRIVRGVTMFVNYSDWRVKAEPGFAEIKSLEFHIFCHLIMECSGVYVRARGWMQTTEREPLAGGKGVRVTKVRIAKRLVVEAISERPLAEDGAEGDDTSVLMILREIAR